MFQQVAPLFAQHNTRLVLNEGDLLRLPVPQELKQQLGNDKDVRLRLQFLPAFSASDYQPTRFQLTSVSSAVQTVVEDTASQLVKIYDVNNDTPNFQLTFTPNAAPIDNPASQDATTTWFFHEWGLVPANPFATGKQFKLTEDSGWYSIDALLDKDPANSSSGKKWTYLASVLVEGYPPSTHNAVVGTTLQTLTRYDYQFAILQRRPVVATCIPHLDRTKAGSLLRGSSYKCVAFNRGRGPWDKRDMTVLSDYLVHVDKSAADRRVAWRHAIEQQILLLEGQAGVNQARAVLYVLTERDIELVQVLLGGDWPPYTDALRYAVDPTGASIGRAWEEKQEPWRLYENFEQVERRILDKVTATFASVNQAIRNFRAGINVADGRADVDAMPPFFFKQAILAMIDAKDNAGMDKEPAGPGAPSIRTDLEQWRDVRLRDANEKAKKIVEALRRAISIYANTGYALVSDRSDINAVLIPKSFLSPSTTLVFTRYLSSADTVGETQTVLLSYNGDVELVPLEAGDGKTFVSLGNNHARWIKLSDDATNPDKAERAINRFLNSRISDELIRFNNAPRQIIPYQPESLLPQLHANRGLYLAVDGRSSLVLGDERSAAYPVVPPGITYPVFPLRATRLVRWAFDDEELDPIPFGVTITIDASDLAPEGSLTIWRLPTPRSDPSRYAHNSILCAQGTRALTVRPVHSSDYGNYVMQVRSAAGGLLYETRFHLRHIIDANCFQASEPVGFVARELAKFYGFASADQFAYEQPHRYRYARDLDYLVRYYRLDQQPYGTFPFSLLYDDLRYIPGVDRELSPPYLRYHPPTSAVQDEGRQFVVFDPLKGRWEYFQLSRDSKPLSELEQTFKHFLAYLFTPVANNAIVVGGAAVQPIGLNMQELATNIPLGAAGANPREKAAVQSTIGSLALDYFRLVGERQVRGVQAAILGSQGASADPFNGLPVALVGDEGLEETVPGIRAPEKLFPPVRGATRVQSFATWLEERANAFEVYLEVENSLVDLSRRGSTSAVIASEVPLALILVWLDHWAALYRQQNRVTRAHLLESVYRQMTRNFENLLARVDRGALMEAASIRGGERFRSDQLFWLPFSDRLPNKVRDSLYEDGGINAIRAYERLDEDTRKAWRSDAVSTLYSLGVNRNPNATATFLSVNRDGRRLFTDFELWRYTVTVNDLLISGSRLFSDSTDRPQRSSTNLISPPYPDRRISLYAANRSFSLLSPLEKSTLFEYRTADDELERALRFFEIEVPQDPTHCSAMDDAVESFRRTQPIYHEPSQDALDALDANKAAIGDLTYEFETGYSQLATAIRSDAYGWAAIAQGMVAALPASRRTPGPAGSALGAYQAVKDSPALGSIAFHPGDAPDDPTGLPVPLVMPSSVAASSQAIDISRIPSAADLRATLLDALQANYGSALLSLDAEGANSLLGPSAISITPVAPLVPGIPQPLLDALVNAFPLAGMAAAEAALVAFIATPVNLDPIVDNAALIPLIDDGYDAIAAIEPSYRPVKNLEARMSPVQQAAFAPIEQERNDLIAALLAANTRRQQNDDWIAIQPLVDALVAAQPGAGMAAAEAALVGLAVDPDPNVDNIALIPLIDAGNNAIAAIDVAFVPAQAEEANMSPAQRAQFDPIKLERAALDAALVVARARKDANDQQIALAPDAIAALAEIEALEPNTLLDNATLQNLRDDLDPDENNVAGLKALMAQLGVVEAYETDPVYANFKAAIQDAPRAARLRNLPAAEQGKLQTLKDRETALDNAIANAKARREPLKNLADEAENAQKEFPGQVAEQQRLAAAATQASDDIDDVDETNPTFAMLAELDRLKGVVEQLKNDMITHRGVLDRVNPDKLLDSAALQTAKDELDQATTDADDAIAEADAKKKRIEDTLTNDASKDTKDAAALVEAVTRATNGQNKEIGTALTEFEAVPIDVLDTTDFDAKLQALENSLGDQLIPNLDKLGDYETQLQAAVDASGVSKPASEALQNITLVESKLAANRRADLINLVRQTIDNRENEKSEAEERDALDEIRDFEKVFADLANPMLPVQDDANLQTIASSAQFGPALTESQMQTVEDPQFPTNAQLDGYIASLGNLGQAKADLQKSVDDYNTQYAPKEAGVFSTNPDLKEFYDALDPADLSLLESFFLNLKAARDQTEAARAAEEAERQRLAAEEAERQRLAAEAERQRLEAEEAERQRLAAEAEAERQRLEAEAEAERRRLAEAERKRLEAEAAAEAERQRLAAVERRRQEEETRRQQQAMQLSEQEAKMAEEVATRLQEIYLSRLDDMAREAEDLANDVDRKLGRGNVGEARAQLEAFGDGSVMIETIEKNKNTGLTPAQALYLRRAELPNTVMPEVIGVVLEQARMAKQKAEELLKSALVAAYGIANPEEELFRVEEQAENIKADERRKAQEAAKTAARQKDLDALNQMYSDSLAFVNDTIADFKKDRATQEDIDATNAFIDSFDDEIQERKRRKFFATKGELKEFEDKRDFLRRQLKEGTTKPPSPAASSGGTPGQLEPEPQSPSEPSIQPEPSVQSEPVQLTSLNNSIAQRPALSSPSEKWVNSIFVTNEAGTKRISTKTNEGRWSSEEILYSVYGTTKNINKDDALKVLNDPSSLSFNGESVAQTHAYDVGQDAPIFKVYEGNVKDTLLNQEFDEATVTVGMIDPALFPTGTGGYWAEEPGYYKVTNPLRTQPKLIVLGVSAPEQEAPKQAELIGAKGSPAKRGGGRGQRARGAPSRGATRRLSGGALRVPEPKKSIVSGGATRVPVEQQAASSSSSTSTQASANKRVLHLLVIPPYKNTVSTSGLQDETLFESLRTQGCVSTKGFQACMSSMHRPFHLMYTEHAIWSQVDVRQKMRKTITPAALDPSDPNSSADVKIDGASVFGYARLDYPHATYISRAVNKNNDTSSSMYFAVGGLPDKKNALAETHPTLPAVSFYKREFGADSKATSEIIQTTGTAFASDNKPTPDTQTYIRSGALNYATIQPEAGVNSGLEMRIKHGVGFQAGRGLSEFTKALVAKLQINNNDAREIRYYYKKAGADNLVSFFGSPDGTVCIDQPDFFTKLMTEEEEKEVVYNDIVSKVVNLRDPTDPSKESEPYPWIADKIEEPIRSVAPGGDLLSFDAPIPEAKPSSPLASFYSLFGFGNQ